ncbi:MAG TPA: hypothetical protein VG096_15215 [Bryobacteraceae bacterium]|nr:hypothetical protein [Bryobacteraceae bacterium]
MALIRPRLTEYHGIFLPQAELDFAIPFFEEDIPLYVDPFLLWKSPSYQDKALHNAVLNSFNHLGLLAKKDRTEEAEEQLIIASECEEVGLGLSATRNGLRIGSKQAKDILQLFETVPEYDQRGFTHFEEIQFFVDGISKDRISDFGCTFMKSFLIDFTIDQCEKLGIPLADCTVPHVYDLERRGFVTNQRAKLPINPMRNTPLLLVPRRWLRYSPWINFDEYFSAHCPRDEIVNPDAPPPDRVRVLQYNRENYGVVESYIRAKEKTAADCTNDPLFRQIPVLSARRKLAEIRKLPTGKVGNADKEFENAATQLVASLLYPHLDFADAQSRTDSGVHIRDLVFYNNRSHPFLRDIFDDYGCKQIVMELKNVAELEKGHVDQLNRYMDNEFGKFGVLITRNAMPKPIWRNTIDLWSGQRRCIIALTDEDVAQMVELFESKQRTPLDVLNKKYREFRRSCPS